MKNKALTYGLIAVVIALWGYIIYSIFSSVAGDDTPPSLAKTSIQPEKVNLDYYRPKDGLLLTVDYPDPMLKGTAEEGDLVDVGAGMALDNEAYYTPPPAPPQTQVDYLGYIENQSDKRATAILAIQGKQYMLNVGDEQQQVKVLQIKSEFVKIRADGEIKIIYQH